MYKLISFTNSARDKDGDGKLNLDELRAVITDTRKYLIPDEEISKAFEMADGDKDGKIDFQGKEIPPCRGNILNFM